MKLLDFIEIKGHNDKRIDLYVGDLTALSPSEAFDLLIISAFPDDYTPTPSSLIGALNRKGLSVQFLADTKEIDLRDGFSCWLSKEFIPENPDLRFRRILCFEPSYLHRQERTPYGQRPIFSPELVGDIFRSLMPIVAEKSDIKTVALPVVSTGDQRYSISEMLPPLLDAAINWLENGLPLNVIKIIAYTDVQMHEALPIFSTRKAEYMLSMEAIKSQSVHYDVFISHANKNEYESKVVEYTLRQFKPNIKILTRNKEINIGSAWQPEIFENIDKCSVVITMLSSDYLESKTCKEEFNIAWIRSKEIDKDIIFPIYLYTTSLPTYMKVQNHFNDCRNGDKEKIINSSKKILNLLANNENMTPPGLLEPLYDMEHPVEIQLQIDHDSSRNEKSVFNVKRLIDGKESKPVRLTPLSETAMEGMVEGAESNLQQELHWYLEEFPGSLILNEKGYKKFAAQANHVEEYLEKWGKECFSQLFQDNARDWFRDASENGSENLRLKISSDDPKILAWPWEALRDWDGKPLAQLCHIERQLNNVSDPLPLVDNLPQNCINILLVIARPKGERDVSFHALSRPLLELIHKEQLPIRLDVLRPPTFNQLRHTLHNKPGYYHIVHFDGHGAYQTDQQQGVLLFENDAGEANSVNADTLATLLHEHRIPVMILNACQSAQIDGQAEDAFASVAASLLKAGIRSVVAMGYVLYVGGAKHFVPAFYRRLVESGDVGEALRAGRQAMLADNMRVVSAYEYPLQDWLVPVLYQQLPQNEHVLPKLVATAAVPIPPEIKDIPALGAYGFIGRESMVQKLERALLRQKQAGILIHGLKGIGKTTLLIGFMQWLRDTNGLPAHFHWFDFSKVGSLSQVADKLLAALPNMGAASLPIEQKLDRLVGALQTTPHLLVWDNFEVAGGNSAAGIAPQLPADELALLKNFFRQLRNGKVNETKILLASDQSETWLEHTECFRLKLDGLETDECWEFASAVLADLGLKVKRTNQDFKFLLEDLGAHPLAMQRALPHLERMDTFAINSLRKALRENAPEDTSDTARFILAAMKR